MNELSFRSPAMGKGSMVHKRVGTGRIKARHGARKSAGIGRVKVWAPGAQKRGIGRIKVAN